MWYSVRVLHIDRDSDVALLRLPRDQGWRTIGGGFPVVVLSVRFLPPVGSELRVITSNGNIIYLENNRSRSAACTPSFCTPVWGEAMPGISGSPVLDERGHLVGMVYGGFSDDPLHIVIITGGGIQRAIVEYIRASE